MSASRKSDIASNPGSSGSSSGNSSGTSSADNDVLTFDLFPLGPHASLALILMYAPYDKDNQDRVHNMLRGWSKPGAISMYLQAEARLAHRYTDRALRESNTPESVAFWQPYVELQDLAGRFEDCAATLMAAVNLTDSFWPQTLATYAVNSATMQSAARKLTACMHDLWKSARRAPTKGHKGCQCRADDITSFQYVAHNQEHCKLFWAVVRASARYHAKCKRPIGERRQPYDLFPLSGAATLAVVEIYNRWHGKKNVREMLKVWSSREGMGRSLQDKVRQYRSRQIRTWPRENDLELYHGFRRAVQNLEGYVTAHVEHNRRRGLDWRPALLRQPSEELQYAAMVLTGYMQALTALYKGSQEYGFHQGLSNVAKFSYNGQWYEDHARVHRATLWSIYATSYGLQFPRSSYVEPDIRQRRRRDQSREPRRNQDPRERDYSRDGSPSRGRGTRLYPSHRADDGRSKRDGPNQPSRSRQESKSQGDRGSKRPMNHHLHVKVKATGRSRQFYTGVKNMIRAVRDLGCVEPTATGFVIKSP